MSAKPCFSFAVKLLLLYILLQSLQSNMELVSVPQPFYWQGGPLLVLSIFIFTV